LNRAYPSVFREKKEKAPCCSHQAFIYSATSVECDAEFLPLRCVEAVVETSIWSTRISSPQYRAATKFADWVAAVIS
jgi:hypothetical protein